MTTENGNAFSLTSAVELLLDDRPLTLAAGSSYVPVVRVVGGTGLTATGGATSLVHVERVDPLLPDPARFTGSLAMGVAGLTIDWSKKGAANTLRFAFLDLVVESAAFDVRHPTPYTRHPPPYTLHPTPCTRHPTPYTLHPTPCTRHPAPYTLHPTPQPLHPTPYTLHPTP